MSDLSKELEKSKDEKKEVVVDVESLSDIVECELHNVAGGGYEQWGPVHDRSAN